MNLLRSPNMSIKFSVVVPCYNEEACLRTSIERLHKTLVNECTLEIVIVDDCSKDKSVAIANALASELPGIVIYQHKVNQGKGAALRTGFSKAAGDIIAIHDADLEYNPEDLKRMLHFMIESKADAVFGTRFQHQRARRVSYFWHTFANHVITFWCNMWTNLNLTDIECCYKMFSREMLKKITIEDDRFGVEPELVSKCSKVKINGQRPRIFEMGVDYHARSYDEGKKIGVKDGIRALWAIVKYNIR